MTQQQTLDIKVTTRVCQKQHEMQKPLLVCRKTKIDFYPAARTPAFRNRSGGARAVIAKEGERAGAAQPKNTT
jgi:hypothetical protein